MSDRLLCSELVPSVLSAAAYLFDPRVQVEVKTLTGRSFLVVITPAVDANATRLLGTDLSFKHATSVGAEVTLE